MHRLNVSLLYLPTLTPAHACAPISHAWLKNVSCCRPAWHNFQKYVNSDPCKERKPCVKWINGNTFGHLRKTSDFFGNLRKWSCRLQKSQHSQDKNLTLISQKQLAGIRVSLTIVYTWQDHVLESLQMAFFVVILDSKYSKMTPKFVKQKSRWLHSSIKFANPAHAIS